jgi:hypothetical protein
MRKMLRSFRVAFGFVLADGLATDSFLLPRSCSKRVWAVSSRAKDSRRSSPNFADFPA